MTETQKSRGDESWFHDEPGEVAVAAERSIPGSPTWPLLLAAGGLLLAAVTLAGGVGLQVIGYLSASLLLFTAVAWFRRSSIERAVKFGLSTSSRLNAVAILMLVAGFALALVHAWKIAIHFS